ncbi:uncharacterized protein LOC135372498 [Ornithodoros turicata]|uniref:uncharacterized protein LOC135372498 n=1 Tax=Ornithodoros turicata TaxID=34597 RepID=UPI0031391D17
MKLCAIVFVLGTMLAVASAECPKEQGFIMTLECAYTLRLDPSHRDVIEWDVTDLSDPSQFRAICCYLDALEMCLKYSLQGECSYAADKIFQQHRDALVGDLSCADKC